MTGTIETFFQSIFNLSWKRGQSLKANTDFNSCNFVGFDGGKVKKKNLEVFFARFCKVL